MNSFQKLQSWGNLSQIALDTEFSSLNPFQSELYAVQFGTEEEQIVLEWHKLTQQQKDYVAEFISNDSICKVGHNIKADLSQLAVLLNIYPQNVYDTMIGHTVLYNGLGTSASLSSVVEIYCGITLEKEVRNNFLNRQKDQDFTEEEIEYCKDDVKYLLKIRQIQENEIKHYNLEHCNQLEQSLVPILCDIELRGINFDSKKWLENNEERKKELIPIKEELYELLGMLYILRPEIAEISYVKKGKFSNFLSEFSVNSPLQLNALFEHLIKLPNTNSNTIKSWLQKEKPTSVLKEVIIKFLTALLEYRGLSKSISTYGERFLSYLGKDIRIRTSFKQNFIPTGRLSSGDIKNRKINTKGTITESRANLYVNFQNIPSESSYRNCFLADEGYLFGTCDLSGCELRIIAGLSQDPLLIGAVMNNEDLHSKLATASFRIITGDPNYIVSSSVNKDKRTLHKPVLFGLLYGAAAPNISAILNIPVSTGKLVYEAIRELLKPCFEYLDWYSKKCIKQGFAIVNDVTNRRLWLGDYLKYRNQNLPYPNMDRLIRTLYNVGMQGTNADIMKEILITVSKIPEVIVLGTVHDELKFQIPENKPELATTVREVMEEIGTKYLKNTVTMKADLHLEKFWTK